MASRVAFTASLSLFRGTSHAAVSACPRVSTIGRTMMTAPPPRSTKPVSPPQSLAEPSTRPKLTLLFDGECPLCVKEVKFLKDRSSQYDNSLGFVDVASTDYDSSSNADIPYDIAMGRIHAIDSEGRVITGVKVFRDAYDAVGLGWVYALTKVPGVSWLAEKVYNIWADRRLQLTGRPPLVDILRERERTCRK